jgi:hypothetical protein
VPLLSAAVAWFDGPLPLPGVGPLLRLADLGVVVLLVYVPRRVTAVWALVLSSLIGQRAEPSAALGAALAR